MKLQIEKWVEDKAPFVDQAKDLFEESVSCYKIGAYKSAFIMSYLAFKVTIRNRIIECKYLPKNFVNDKMWQNQILNDLNNDDKWEEKVNLIVTADPNIKKENSIMQFENREQILNQYNFWREYRNACAHAKDRIINSSTVESFWNYIEDNLSKFYVLGGKVYLLGGLLDFYKYRNNEKIERKELLIYDIKIIYGDDTCEYFTKFIEEVHRNEEEIVNDDNSDFWKSILHSAYPEIQNGLIKAISSKEYYFKRFYVYYPEILELTVGVDNKFVMDNLSKWLETWIHDKNTNQCFWNLLCILLEKINYKIDINDVCQEGCRIKFYIRYLYNLFQNFQSIFNIYIS